MPIGLYTLAHARPTCGLASTTGLIGMLDDPASFFVPERAGAEILWTSDGFVEYVFSGGVPTSRPIERLEFMAEMCSEAPHTAPDWPSDLTLWIDGVEIATWTSLGDYGSRRGRSNPAWWPDHMTQHGVLKVWSMDETGSFVDGVRAGKTTIADLRLMPNRPITVRLGVKPEAEHRGGFNLFGKGFGDYGQDLLLRLHYGEAPRIPAQSDSGCVAVSHSFVEFSEPVV
ncbi:hypothetical protein EON81_27805 [bacterium]|nr:MAG: hypothetical protein EON81_27805 [bacterium]